MIELACIFTTGGVILFYKAFVTLKFDPIDVLIKKVLIQDRTGETSLHTDPYIIKWRLANDIGLIFTVVYREMFHVLFIDELLDLLKTEYVNNFYPKITIKNNLYKLIPDFDEGFKEVLRKWELKQEKTQHKQAIMKRFDQTIKGKEIKQKEPIIENDKKKKKGGDGNSNDKSKELTPSSDDENIEDNATTTPGQASNVTSTSNEDVIAKTSPEKSADSIAEARKKLGII